MRNQSSLMYPRCWDRVVSFRAVCSRASAASLSGAELRPFRWLPGRESAEVVPHDHRSPGWAEAEPGFGADDLSAIYLALSNGVKQ
jgi:hypothetical protein